MNSEPLPQHLDLIAKVHKFPVLPGVYLMHDSKGNVIYVGKAKSLRARVRSYFNGHDGRFQISYLIRRVVEIEVIVTETEHQAFVLERDLITKHKPRYNIRLKDDKNYLSIRVDESAPWPRLELVRKVNRDGARYFGPYSFSYELRTLLETVRRVVPLRTCSDTVFYNRTRPCLEYQIKRCAGPCCLPVEKSQYAQWVRQATNILEGKSGFLQKELEVAMDKASEEMRFEDAALIRDRIKVLEQTADAHPLVSNVAEDKDCFALYREETLAVMTVLHVRLGRVVDSTNVSLSELEVSDEEVFEAALSQFYEKGRDLPQQLLLPLELENQSMIEAELKRRGNRAVTIETPKRGVKKRLLDLALLNARQFFSSTLGEEDRNAQVHKELARLIGLKQVPRRIECLDISNLQGSDIVGAVVAFMDGKPDKDNYRKFILSFQEKPDDFKAVYEVVRRRFLDERIRPDLLVIDGGPQQLAKAREALAELDIQQETIALAKERSATGKPERIFLETSGEAIELPADNRVTHFLARVRDEAHRFVITFHRQRRKKRVVSSKLDQILGVGTLRRERLLKHFGSVEEIAIQEISDIARIGRMPLSLASKIKKKLLE